MTKPKTHPHSAKALSKKPVFRGWRTSDEEEVERRRIRASTESMTTGVLLLGVYSLGLAIPFLITGMAVGSFLGYYKGITKHMKGIMLISGLVLVFIGGLMVLGLFQRLFVLFA